MNQPKPILTIKQKCGECDGIKITIDKSVEKDMQMKAGVYVCKSCKGIGQQTTEIYALRDFEKCNGCSGTGEQLGKLADTKDGMVLVMQPCEDCKGVDYIIPKEYKPYEIKKVSEITEEEAKNILLLNDKIISDWAKRNVQKSFSTFHYKPILKDIFKEYNLEEDDKVVMRRK